MRRWLLPALLATLFLSLTANFVTLGYVLGQGRGERPGMAFATGALGNYSQGMRREIRAEFLAHRTEMRAGIRTLRQARRAMAAALEAEPYDDARAREAMRRLREETSALQEKVHASLLAAAERSRK